MQVMNRVNKQTKETK